MTSSASSDGEPVDSDAATQFNRWHIDRALHGEPVPRNRRVRIYFLSREVDRSGKRYADQHVTDARHRRLGDRPEKPRVLELRAEPDAVLVAES